MIKMVGQINKLNQSMNNAKINGQETPVDLAKVGKKGPEKIETASMDDVLAATDVKKATAPEQALRAAASKQADNINPDGTER
jgi:hypothetical protein